MADFGFRIFLPRQQIDLFATDRFLLGSFHRIGHDVTLVTLRRGRRDPSTWG